MLAVQFTEAVTGARNGAMLDNLARLLWRAHAEGHLSDVDAEAASEAVQARRRVFASPAAVAQAAPVSARRKPVTPRSPNRQASLERRRRQAASGALPPQLAALFTLGEVAVLSVVARQCQRAGVCSLPIDALAALAGVSRSLAKGAIRRAATLGLIERRERRRRGWRSETNLLRIIDSSWTTWSKLSARGGGRNPPSTNTSIPIPVENSRKLDIHGWRCRARQGISERIESRGRQNKGN